jgi:hypothetical protein
VPDSSAVDAAIVAKLSSDGPLMALLPDGVYFDLAPEGSSAFVLVAQLAHHDEPLLGGETAWEEFTYLVKAVAPGPSGDVVKAAAARIHEVLQHALLNPAGYVDMHCARVERPRDQEIDDINEARWNHRGGHYEVWVTAAPVGE